MICLTPKPSRGFFIYHVQSKEKMFTEKNFKEKGEWRIEQKNKKAFNCSLFGE